jgi:hypothetical protein
MRWVVASLLLMLGCDPGVFDDIKNNTPVVDINRPDSMQFETFGTKILGYVHQNEGVLVSRLAMSSGPGTPIRVNRGWDGKTVEVTKKALDVCVDPAACDASQIVSMTPLRRWGEQTACMASAGPESSTRPNAALNIVCESNPTQTITQDAPPGGNFGASAAQLPEAIEPLGLAIVGAPFENATDGSLYLVADDQAPVPLALSESTAVDGLQGRLGSAVAADAGEVQNVLVAATSPGANRVVVGLLTNTVATLTIHACLQGDANWTPLSLAVGNLNNESAAGSYLAPELVVGVDTTADSVVDHLEIYDGQDLPSGAGCNAWDSTPTVISCPDAVAEEFRCSEAAFGASIAIGDLNGDGIGDLIVGAPGATAEGKLQAGSIAVYLGTTRNDAGELQFEAPVLVKHPHPGTGARLGSSVAALSTGQNASRRDELVAGAPGNDDESGTVTAFLCTPIARDTSSSTGLDEQCLPSSD